MKAIGAILLSGIALSRAAGDGIDGQYAAVTPSGPSGVVLELKSEGRRLTGWLAQPNGKLEITNGSILGNAVSFEMTVNMQGRTLVLVYAGQLDGDELRLTLRSEGIPGEEQVSFRRVNPTSPLDRFSEAAAPDEVAAWLKTNAIRLALDDLAPLRARLKDARVVAMGEATHGTREFQQIKVHMFRYLVENLGFTVFGLETNWPESLAVNDYVLGGDVDPTAGLGFLWWKTEEMFGLLRWMREYNQDPAHTRKLKFYGFDMQVPELAESNVRDYLRRVDPDFEVLGSRTAESLDALLRRFDERKAEWVRRSSQQEWTIARQNMAIVKAAEWKLAHQDERGRAYRDRAMAENVKWILDQEPPGTKMMLWAHNGHLATAAGRDMPDYMPMGGYLREFFGDRLVSCGFVFQQGSFRAVDMSTSRVAEFTVGPAPRGSLDATLAGVGAPLFAVDLRRLPEGKVADWFAAPHFSRQIGGGYSEATPGVWMHRMRAAREFDLLIFVDKTTPSR